MCKVLLAGATGYLGKYIAQELRARLIPSVLIGRNEEKLNRLAGDDTEYKVLEVTEPESVAGCCEGIDVVISTVGITRQRDGLTYWDVDFQANRNLLDEAERAGVSQFIYVSVFRGDAFRHLKMIEAKEAFVDELKAARLESVVIRPNGFFSDMEDFLSMAKKGKVYLFGKGEKRFNPIHGEDLAKVCVDQVGEPWGNEVDVGGPEVLSHYEVANLALEAVSQTTSGKKGNVRLIPDWIRLFCGKVLRWVTPQSVYGPVEFFLTVMGEDFVAPLYGTRTLGKHFIEVAGNRD